MFIWKHFKKLYFRPNDFKNDEDLKSEENPKESPQPTLDKILTEKIPTKRKKKRVLVADLTDDDLVFKKNVKFDLIIRRKCLTFLL